MCGVGGRGGACGGVQDGGSGSRWAEGVEYVGDGQASGGGGAGIGAGEGDAIGVTEITRERAPGGLDGSGLVIPG